jgi:hypothetical protein
MIYAKQTYNILNKWLINIRDCKNTYVHSNMWTLLKKIKQWA